MGNDRNATRLGTDCSMLTARLNPYISPTSAASKIPPLGMI